MPRYVAFLRGMNLGKRRIKNPELAAEFEQLGFEDVATFRASGNVVFSVPGKEGEAALGKRIEAGLEQGLGYEVKVFLRSVAEVAEIASREPFDAKAVEAANGKPQVALLPKAPPAKQRKAALAEATAEDPITIEGRELHWLPSGGVTETELDLKAVEKAVGPWTMRTAGTIEQIATKYCGD